MTVNINGARVITQVPVPPTSQLVVQAATEQAEIATTKASEASSSAATATAQAVIATEKAVLTAADRVQTGLDVIATNADAVATAADRVQTGLDAIATAANSVQTGFDAAAALAAKNLAETARDAALLSKGIFETTAKALSNGVIEVVMTAATGSDGVYDLIFSTGNAKGKIVKTGSTFEYISQYTGDSYASAPIVTATGLTGIAATVVIAPNVDVNEYFSVPVVGSNNSLILYKNVAGVATEINRYPSAVGLNRTNLASAFLSQVTAETNLNNIRSDGTYFGQASAFTNIPPSGLNPSDYFMLDVKSYRYDGEYTVQTLYRYPDIDRWWDRMIIAGVANAWVRKDLVKTDAVGTSQILASAVTRAKLADSFEYNETLSTGTLNTPLKSGVYLVTSGVSDRPVGMGSYLGILENWGSGDYFIQRMSTRNFPNLRWSRDVRLSNGTYNAWSLDSLQRTDFDRIAGKKIAFLGDSITANYLLPETITANLASVMYNFGIGGTRLANHTTAGYDKLSGYQIAAAINSGNWTDVIAGATTVRDTDPLSYQYVLDRANAMAALDWSTIDYIVIGYGTNDFGGNNQVGVIGDAVGSTFYGALNLTIESILSSKPNVRLLFWSPIWRRRTPVDPSGISGGSDVSANTNGNYMTDFVDAMRAGCIKKHIEFLDLYHTSGIYETTYLNYLVDQLHPTTNGVNLLAAKISGFLQKSF